MSLKKQPKFSEEDKLLLAELCKHFPEIENKAYNSRSLASSNPCGIKWDIMQIP